MGICFLWKQRHCVIRLCTYLFVNGDRGLTGNHNATPNKIAKYAQDNGYYLKGTGTSWSLLTEGASHFGVVGREISLSKETVCDVLKQGQPVICSVGRGDFTTEGHFIVLTGMKDGRIKVNDPNCIHRSCLWSMRHWNHRLKIYGRIMDEGYLQKAICLLVQ